jgi:Leucine-rich repeat (LRR) protein
MPTPIGNKTVVQLVELTSDEVVPQDLLYIVDVDANESKKIQVSQFGLWLNASGSVYAVRAILADTASYILGSNVFGSVNSSSYALLASTSSFAQFVSQSLSAISSSYALTASFSMNGGGSGSNTASYLLYQGVPNGTSSYALNAATADTSTATSFLLYFGGNNGTASYAITTQNVQHATTSDTASYFNNSVSGSVATASYALLSQQTLQPNSSSYLIFTPSISNGTASYAMASKAIINTIVDYGVFLAYTQSAYEAQLDDVDVFWSTTQPATTPIEAVGTIIVPFTSSTATSGTVYLSTLDRNTGIQNVLDATPIYFNSNSNSTSSYGQIKMPFSLMGQSNLYGSYMMFVSSSNNLQIEPTRTVRFSISSESDILSSSINVPFTLTVFPSSSINFTFTSTDGGPFTDKITGLLHTMSLNKKIFTLNAINQGMISMNYFWPLTAVTESNFSNNPLTNLGGIPSSLTYLSCSNCNLTSFYTFASSSLSTLNCSSNFLTSLPTFPSSMSYINCSNNALTSLNLPLTLSYLNCSLNQLTSLPNNLSTGLRTFLADNNNIQLLPPSLPNTIVSMSMNNNYPLLNFSSLPSQSVYLSFNNCSNMGSLPTIPLDVLYLSVQSCSFVQSVVDNILSNLVSNAMVSGTIDIRGNGPLDPTGLTYISQLQYNAWTTFYDV